MSARGLRTLETPALLAPSVETRSTTTASASTSATLGAALNTRPVCHLCCVRVCVRVAHCRCACILAARVLKGPSRAETRRGPLQSRTSLQTPKIWSDKCDGVAPSCCALLAMRCCTKRCQPYSSFIAQGRKHVHTRTLQDAQDACYGMNTKTAQAHKADSIDRLETLQQGDKEVRLMNLFPCNLRQQQRRKHPQHESIKQELNALCVSNPTSAAAALLHTHVVSSLKCHTAGKGL